MEINAREIKDEFGRNGLTEEAEIECHACGKKITADIDLGVSGNHVIICPCGHEHCRVVRNGRITSSRWDQRNGDIPASTQTAIYVTATSATATTVGSYSGTGITVSTATPIYYSVITASS